LSSAQWSQLKFVDSITKEEEEDGYWWMTQSEPQDSNTTKAFESKLTFMTVIASWFPPLEDEGLCTCDNKDQPTKNNQGLFIQRFL
jgi:hypothetical protein